MMMLVVIGMDKEGNDDNRSNKNNSAKWKLKITERQTSAILCAFLLSETDFVPGYAWEILAAVLPQELDDKTVDNDIFFF